MDCDEGPSVENNSKNELHKDDENADAGAVSTSDSVDQSKESEEAKSHSNGNDSKDIKNPENFLVFQNNKEQKSKTTKEDSKKSKQNNSVAVNGNEESQCSVYEPSTEIQNCYWYLILFLFDEYLS